MAVLNVDTGCERLTIVHECKNMGVSSYKPHICVDWSNQAVLICRHSNLTHDADKDTSIYKNLYR